MPISIAIVEDDADIADEISKLIEETPDFKLSCCCRNMHSALERIPALAPDVVIMDINLPDGSGIQATAQIKRILPKTEVMIFTIYENTEDIYQALEAGASGYLLKRSSSSTIVSSIRNMMKGEVPMTAAIARKVIQSFQRKEASTQSNPAMASLTPRELDILQLLAKGHPTKEIASQRSISVDTVNTHLRRIYEKLHVHSRAEAILKYLDKK
ncbi:DNA-binding NarL/FixJ family response regulator [Ereboglobus sp. PH5-10]|uniref:response regulator transcription factor n=1 Tax=Ereboglobus sp. PH5-10 TaxID=2940629 RepID=UPI00240495A0|nr:response regulator transcription factor [Ereboglobus sp. PH5-10]MDF9827909.1 DNA-binding NarL/FixJ family response regulator [Ereboglobus sp. PH5-10]